MKLPQHEFAEQGILGVLIRFGHLAKLSKLNREDFYSEQHKSIFDAIQALAKADKPVDCITVQNQLEMSRRLELAGGNEYLMDLHDSSVSSVGWEGWEDIVRKKSTLRAGIAIAQNLTEQSMSDEMDADDLIADLAKAVSDLSKRSTTVTVTSWADAFTKATEAKEENVSIPTGIGFLDRILDIRPGQLGIIAGRPGDGKSALASQMILQIAKADETLFDSLEMSPEEVAQRIIAQETGTPLFVVDSMSFHGRYSRGPVDDCANKFKISFCSASTVQELRSIAMVRKAHHGLKIIVVDYLQLLRVKRPSASRAQDVTEISRDLKLMAMELQVPVIALSQFSREAAKGPPELHHLRESGSIEQDADWVLFAYTEKTNEGEVKMISLAKNRRGSRVPAFAVGFNGPTVSFGEETL